MSDPTYRLELTNAQRIALCTIISEYLQNPTHVETFVDVIAQVETTPEELLRLLLTATPMLTAAPADVLAEARAAVAAGGSHDCSEWNEHGRCVLCDRAIPRRRDP
jgi:hypothetical protein